MRILRLTLLALALAAAPAHANESSSQGTETDRLADVVFDREGPALPFASVRFGVALAGIVAWAEVYPEGTIIINGHADRDGASSAANVRLSLARAQLVRAQLVERGVEPERIVLAAFGDQAPTVEARRSVVVWGTRPAVRSAPDRRARPRVVAAR